MNWSKEFQTTALQDLVIVATGLAVVIMGAFLIRKFSRKLVDA